MLTKKNPSLKISKNFLQKWAVADHWAPMARTMLLLRLDPTNKHDWEKEVAKAILFREEPINEDIKNMLTDEFKRIYHLLNSHENHIHPRILDAEKIMEIKGIEGHRFYTDCPYVIMKIAYTKGLVSLDDVLFKLVNECFMRETGKNLVADDFENEFNIDLFLACDVWEINQALCWLLDVKWTRNAISYANHELFNKIKFMATDGILSKKLILPEQIIPLHDRNGIREDKPYPQYFEAIPPGIEPKLHRASYRVYKGNFIDWALTLESHLSPISFDKLNSPNKLAPQTIIPISSNSFSQSNEPDNKSKKDKRKTDVSKALRSVVELMYSSWGGYTKSITELKNYSKEIPFDGCEDCSKIYIDGKNIHFKIKNENGKKEDRKRSILTLKDYFSKAKKKKIPLAERNI